MFYLLFSVWVLIISKSIVSSNILPSDGNSEGEVKQVHVLFRHGDRANDIGTVYPNDPYINETYYPYGVGQLTNKGRQREYMIGKTLRKRYNTFLGNLYTVDILEAISTNMNRTKMSLDLVTAGLFPPVNTGLEWNRELNWQPIPYNYVPFEQDQLLTLSLFYCPNYVQHYQEYLRSPQGMKIQRKYSDLYPYLTKHTGKAITTTLDIYVLYFGLEAELEWGLQLPDWTISVFPKYIERAAIDQYIVGSATTKLKQLSGGFLLKKVINEMQAKIDNTLVPESRKMYLYSGHEMNVAYFLNALEVYFPHVPPYGAFVIVELVKIKTAYYVKILYQDYSAFDPQPLTVPGCSKLCPFKKFVILLQKNLPLEDNPCDVYVLRDIETQILRYNGY